MRCIHSPAQLCILISFVTPDCRRLWPQRALFRNWRFDLPDSRPGVNRRYHCEYGDEQHFERVLRQRNWSHQVRCRSGPFSVLPPKNTNLTGHYFSCLIANLQGTLGVKKTLPLSSCANLVCDFYRGSLPSICRYITSYPCCARQHADGLDTVLPRYG